MPLDGGLGEEKGEAEGQSEREPEENREELEGASIASECGVG